MRPFCERAPKQILEPSGEITAGATVTSKSNAASAGGGIDVRTTDAAEFPVSDADPQRVQEPAIARAATAAMARAHAAISRGRMPTWVVARTELEANGPAYWGSLALE